MGKNQRRALGLFDDIRDRECFTAAGNAEQNLLRRTLVEALDQLTNGLGLIALWLIITYETKLHTLIIQNAFDKCECNPGCTGFENTA